MQKITYKEALSILPAVVDGESNELEKNAFFSLMEGHPQLRNEYENAIHVKRLLKNRLPRYNAPEHLKEKILIKLCEIEKTKQTENAGDNVSGSGKYLNERTIENYRKKQSGQIFRYIAAAAVVLLISLTIIRLLDDTTTESATATLLSVEYLAAHHFQLTGGQLIEPHWKSNSVTEAELYLRENFDLTLTVPPIESAEFAGIVMAEFYDNYHIPLLEYIQPEIGETIYVFVFDVNDITSNSDLKRDDEAVQKCVHSHDFHVAEIDNHHVVSWMWEDNWYTAISNHNGYDLASLVVPLNP